MKWYLDFGHGGKDPGALGTNSTKESDTVLKIGMIIKNNLEEAFEKVITTRKTDKYYSLDYRSQLANKSNCDYFISLHMNSSTNKSAKGCEVWVYDKSSKVYPLAKTICSNLSKAINTSNRGVKISKDFFVLRKTKIPALLIEIDFISNSVVENNLSSPKYIKDIADSISSTLLSFVDKSIIDEMSNANFYRVCIGAFKNKTNAVNLKNKAISKGFNDTYII
ncbi:N-acetylmuramoyl-L-alanine amidase family protein [Romboutsia sp. 1001713B170131_170501_G6]|uniref:N-acetylmuramoyl-L-alanine amidase family protein n=1 Tax=Romboutsia sp. 1001713B170131_170501_G6 TaxID=2787108 RepID=UPI0018AB36CB|nr:N-acetylmuramoyl-L-alanine amidase [Romboutsia sp. 1001713B170131_170501_G6]